MSKKQYEYLTIEQRKDLTDTVKALNQRLRDLENKGLTRTPAYKNLSSWVASMPNKLDKKGNLRAVQTYKLTPEQQRRTTAIKGNKQATAGAEVKRITGELVERGVIAKGEKPTREQIQEHITRYDDLHDFITHHKEAYYNTELHTAVKRPWNEKLTMAEADAFLELMKDPIKAEKENRANAQKYTENIEKTYTRKDIF